MKTAIIGAGNMGGAIARGTGKKEQSSLPGNIIVSNPTQGKLDELKQSFLLYKSPMTIRKPSSAPIFIILRCETVAYQRCAARTETEE